RVERRDFEEDIGRLRRHLAVTTTHHTREGLGTLRVRNHAHVRSQRSLDAIERDELFTRLRPTHDDGGTGETLRVECVHGLAEAQQHEVRDVDDVVDRSDTGTVESTYQPVRT